MGTLQVSLDSLGAEHPAIEREFLPRLEANHLVVANLQLNAALLTAEAAMRLDQALGFGAGRQGGTSHHGSMRAKALDDLKLVNRNRRHASTPSARAVRRRAGSMRLPARVQEGPAGSAGKSVDSVRRAVVDSARKKNQARVRPTRDPGPLSSRRTASRSGDRAPAHCACPRPCRS